MANDMIRGSMTRSLLAFSVPLILSGLLQQLFNWADALIVGNVEGDLALAAIGAAGTIPAVALLVITGFASGIGILSARLYGEGERQKLRLLLSTFALIVGGLCAALGLAGSLLAPELLRAMRTAGDTFAMSEKYLRVYLLGTPCVAVYNIYSAVLRGCGDSKAAFFTICVCSVTNVLLDLLFVAALGWGAAGAAAATGLTQCAMAAFIVCYTRKRHGFLRLCPGDKAVDGAMLRQGLGLGLPIAAQCSVKSAGNLALQRFMNGFSSSTVAAITTAYRIDNVLMLPVINFGMGVSTAVAQNIGNGDGLRARRALYVGSGTMVVISIALTGVVLLCGRGLLSLFGLSQESVDIGTAFFYRIARFYLVFGLATVIRNYLEGCGDVLFTSVVNVFALLIRIALSYWIGTGQGSHVFALAESVSWALMLLLYIFRYLWLWARHKPTKQ